MFEFNANAVHSPHDRFFRGVFSHPLVAGQFFRKHLPARLVEAIDWSTLRVMPGSFVDQHLAAQAADLLYRVERRGRPLYLYFLFEHQSTVEEAMRLRLLGYMVRIWEEDIKQHGPGRKLPPIVPIVLHQGTGEWKASTQFLDLVDVPEEVRTELEPHQPKFEHALVDLGQAPPVAQVRGKMVLDVVEELMAAVRQGRSQEWLERGQRVLCELMEQESLVGLVATMVRYWFETAENAASTFRAEMAKLPETKAQRQFMSLAEQLRAEGRQEGRQEGKLMARIQVFQEWLGLPVSTDAELSEVAVSRLQEMLQQLQAQLRQRPA